MANATVMRIDEADDVKSAKALVLAELRHAHRPLRPEDVLDAVRRTAQNVPFSDLRSAIWDLVSAGQLEFTDDWQLRTRR